MGNMTLHAEGNPICSFTNSAVTPIDSLKVYFTPRQSGSGDPSPSNVREIQGWTELETTKCGKNLLDLSSLTNKTGITYSNNQITATGSDLYKAAGTNNKLKIFIPANTVFSASFNASTSGNGFLFCVGYEDGTGEILITVLNNVKTSTYFTYTGSKSKNIVEIAFGSWSNGSNIWHLSNMQVEIGNSPTSFEPYCGQTISVNWANDAGTIYGGYVDLVKGEIIATHMKFVDDGNEDSDAWKKKSSHNNMIVYVRSDVLNSISTNIRTIQTNYCTSPLSGLLWQADISSAAISAGLRIIVPDSISSNNLLVQYLYEHPLEIVYQLTTPISYPLSPIQLQTLLNQNNIWSNTNNKIECNYKLHETKEINNAKRRIAANQPHIETASGDIVSFNTDISAPLKGCKIYFSPI